VFQGAPLSINQRHLLTTVKSILCSSVVPTGLKVK
jgi:hypothetical protein